MTSSLNFKVKFGEVTYDVTNVLLDDSIRSVKHTVQQLSEVPQHQQKWIYKGRILTDEQTVRTAGIAEGDVVIVMRTAATSASSTTTTSGAVGSVLPAGAPPVPVQQLQPRVTTARFDAAMMELLQNPEGAVKDAVGVLAKIAGNIVAHPMEDKYRRLNRTNAAFSKKVGAVPGGASCMAALGFHLEGDEWVLVPSAEAWENLVACKNKLERFATKLSQVAVGADAAATSSSSSSASASASSSSAAAAAGVAGVVPAAAPTAATAPASTAGAALPVDPASILILQQVLQTMQQQQQQPPPPDSSQEVVDSSKGSEKKEEKE